jgi:calpain-15
VSCPQSGEGLVGRHAYSVLEVKEVANVKVGRQKRLPELFNPELGAFYEEKEMLERGQFNDVLRLIKIRNPWFVLHHKYLYPFNS